MTGSGVALLVIAAAVGLLLGSSRASMRVLLVILAVWAVVGIPVGIAAAATGIDLWIAGVVIALMVLVAAEGGAVIGVALRRRHRDS
jgi:hypothetical protein